jgi:hypothetical protein
MQDAPCFLALYRGRLWGKYPVIPCLNAPMLSFFKIQIFRCVKNSEKNVSVYKMCVYHPQIFQNQIQNEQGGTKKTN